MNAPLPRRRSAETEVRLHLCGAGTRDAAGGGGGPQLAAASKGLVSGTLRIAVFHSVASYVLPAAIGAFGERFPDVRVELVEPPVTAARTPNRHNSHLLLDTLRDLRAEVAFTQLPLPAPHEPLDGLVMWELFDDDFVALVAPSLLHEYGMTTFAPRLLLEAQLLTNPDITCGRMVLEHVHRHVGVPLKVQSIRDDVAIASMAQRGIGIGLLPRLAVDDVGDALALVPLEPTLTRTIVVAIRADGLKLPAVRAFLATLGTLYPAAGVPAEPIEWSERRAGVLTSVA